MRNYLQPIVLLLFALTVVNTPTQGQDPRFSQYYASPWNLNPAMTSVFNGTWRTTLNYREQWSSILSPNPFRTYSAVGEYRRALASDDYVGFGLGVMRDEHQLDLHGSVQRAGRPELGERSVDPVPHRGRLRAGRRVLRQRQHRRVRADAVDLGRPDLLRVQRR